MSRREDIDNGIWSDPDFEALTANAKLVYIWSFTNPRCGMAGVYKLPPRAAAIETNLTPDEFMAALAELAESRFVLYEDEVIWVRTRVRHIRTRSPQIAKSIRSDLDKLTPDHPLKAKFLKEYGAFAWLTEAIGSLTDPHPVSYPKAKIGEPHGGSPTLLGNGKGKGKGRGKGLEDSRARADHAKRWAAENLPDLPPDFVAHIYTSMPGDDPAPEWVRECVLAAYPSLAVEAPTEEAA